MRRRLARWMLLRALGWCPDLWEAAVAADQRRCALLYLGIRQQTLQEVVEEQQRVLARHRGVVAARAQRQ